MRRRTLLRRVGTGTAATVGVGGVASARDQPTVTWEFADGHTEELTPAAFDAHPDTPGVSALADDELLAALCCCCYEADGCIECGRRCPCEPDVEP